MQLTYIKSLLLADRELDIKDVNSETEKLRLTDAQREAVRRRVDTLNATIRRKRRASPVCEDGSGVARLTDVFVRKPVMRRTSSEGRKALLKKETSDGNIKSPTAEQAASFPPVSLASFTTYFCVLFLFWGLCAYVYIVDVWSYSARELPHPFVRPFL